MAERGNKMTNKEHIQNCNDEELAREIEQLNKQMEYPCWICFKKPGNLIRGCIHKGCPSDFEIILKWLKSERTADDDTQKENI